MHPHTAGGVTISLAAILGAVFAMYGALGTIPYPQPAALSAAADSPDTSSPPPPGTANSGAIDQECQPFIKSCPCGQTMQNGTCVGSQEKTKNAQNMNGCSCTQTVAGHTVNGTCTRELFCQGTPQSGGQPPSLPTGATAAQQAQPMGSGVPNVSADTAVPGAPSPAGQGLPDASAPSPGAQASASGDDVFGGNSPTPANANGSISPDLAGQLNGQAPNTGVPIGSVGSAGNPFTSAGSADPFTSFGALSPDSSFSNPDAQFSAPPMTDEASPIQNTEGSNAFMPVNGQPGGATPANQLAPVSSPNPLNPDGSYNPNYYSPTTPTGDFSSTNPPGQQPPGGATPPAGGGTPPPGGSGAGQGSGQSGGGSGQSGGGGGSPPSMPKIPQSPQQPQQPQQAQSCSALSQLLSLCPQPSCTITASPSAVQIIPNSTQQPVTLSWQSQNAISAYLSALGSVPISGTYTVYPQSSMPYSLQVTGQYGQASCSANVTVSQQCAAPPAQPTSGCQGTWQAQTTPLSSGASCTTGWQCVPSNGQPAASLSCSPTAAAVGDVITLSYSCSNSTGSSGSGFNTNNQLSGTSTAAIQTPPAGTNTATYGLTCNNSTLSTSTTAECSVQIVTPQISLVANPSSVPSGQTSAIGWVTTGMSSCIVSSSTDLNFTANNANDLSVQGVAPTDPITANTEFDLTCTTVGDTTMSTSTIVTVQ